MEEEEGRKEGRREGKPLGVILLFLLIPRFKQRRSKGCYKHTIFNKCLSTKALKTLVN